MQDKIVRESIIDEGLFNRRKARLWDPDGSKYGFKIPDHLMDKVDMDVKGPKTLEMHMRYFGKNALQHFESKLEFANKFHDLIGDYTIRHHDKEVNDDVYIVDVDIRDWYGFLKHMSPDLKRLNIIK